jgi:enterochelin esterase-like enzyme
MIDGLAKLGSRLGWGVALGLLAFGAARAGDKEPKFSTLPVCASPDQAEVCQRPFTAERAEAVLQAEPQETLAYALHGQTIDIAFKAPTPEFVFGEAPYLCCDLQSYMQPLAPGLWGISIEAPKLSAAVLEITLANLAGGPAPRRTFRGPDATHAIAVWRKGGIVAQRMTIDSRYLKKSRGINVYKGARCQRSVARCKVLYLADGNGFEIFLNNSPSPQALRVLDRMVIVGIDNPGDDNRFGEKRMGELLAVAGDKEAYGAFEHFVVEEVIPFVEPRRVPPKARSVGGWSNGGAWAMSMGLEHGDLFGTALAFSNGSWRRPERAPDAKTLRVKFGGGTLERSSQKFQKDARTLADLGASVDELYVVGGHSMSTWNALFWWAIGT